MSKINVKYVVHCSFFTLLFTFSSIICIGQSPYISDPAGTSDWNLATTWVGGNAPGSLVNNDSIHISAGHIVTYAGDLYETANRLAFNIFGTLNVSGTFGSSNNMDLQIQTGGELIVDSLDTGGKNNMSILVSGTVTITKGMYIGNNSVVLVNGTLNVGGDIEVGSNSSLDGSGTVNVGGDCFGPTSFCESGPLPVELLYFEAKQAGNVLSLEWSTASELNNDYFTIERSGNGADFDLMSTIEGNGTINVTSNYQYTDKNPILGISYYRLSQTDFDGTTEHFPMVSVLFDPDDNKLNVYPNPANDGLLKLQASGKLKNEAFTLRIMDLQGKLMAERSMTADEFGYIDLQINLQNIQRRSAYIFNLISRSENEFVKVFTE